MTVSGGRASEGRGKATLDGPIDGGTVRLSEEVVDVDRHWDGSGLPRDEKAVTGLDRFYSDRL